MDLQIPLTAFFSWPSQARIEGYVADGDSIDASEEAIAKFLIDFTEKSGADLVHLVAHSMGNRGLLRSLSGVAKHAETSLKRPFAQIILAAPDVNVTAFRNRASVYHSVAEHTTLYVSRKDRALAAAGVLNQFRRAGHMPPVTVVPGIDTVEATNVDFSLLGHGYFAAARDLLTDIYYLIQRGKVPPRFGMSQFISDRGEIYWSVGK